MDPAGIFKNLALDCWYKAFVYVGGVLFAIALFIEVKGISNAQLQLIASGMFFVGIGYWKNMKIFSTIKPPNIYTGPAALVSIEERSPDVAGVCFEALGGILVLVGVLSICWSAF